MAARPILLLDLDGVILDIDRYYPEWERLAGDAFAPLLGGDPERWILAEREAWHGPRHAEYLELLRADPEAVPPAEQWDREVHADWIERSCRLVGVEPPATEAERYDAARAARRHYYLHTRASEGASEPIASLAREFEIHTASGNSSWLVEAALEGSGVRADVGEAFGWDLLGVPKDDPHAFYEAILSVLGVAAGRRVVVVDDLAEKLDAAADLGLETVHVARASSDGAHARVGSLAEVPTALGVD